MGISNKKAFGAFALSGVLLLSGCSLMPEMRTSTAIDGTTSIALISGEQVTDELGTYSKLQLDSKNPLLIFNKSAEYVDLPSIESVGFTEADAEAAQKAAVSFVSTEMFDNASADVPTTSAQTLSDVVGRYATGKYLGQLTSPEFRLIYLQPDGVTFLRDGKPRISAMNTKLIEVAGTRYKSDNVPAIDISGATITDYRVSSTGAGAGFKTASVECYWTFRMVPADGTWKILGSETSYDSQLIK